LLVWHKDSYTEKLLALFPCTCILQPKLVHLYQISSLLPGHLPTVTSVQSNFIHLARNLSRSRGQRREKQ
jgi:hypothetical protein